MIIKKYNIEFENIEGIDEESSKKLENIVSKQRGNAIFEKGIVRTGVNNIQPGEKIPSKIQSIDFKVTSCDEEDIESAITELRSEVKELGYGFDIRENSVFIIEFEIVGGIDEDSSKKLRNILNKQRELGSTQILIIGGGANFINELDEMPDKIHRVSFDVFASQNNINALLKEISSEIKELGYKFEIKSELEDE